MYVFKTTKKILSFLQPHWRSIVIVVFPLVLLPLLIVSGTQEARCGYVVLLMAIYWMTEALPLAVTSLLPVMLFPLLGVMSTDEVCVNYLKENNMLLIGGLIVAIAIEHCNLHKRIALRVILTIGTSPRLLMLGFMLNTMFLSMWISNTASAAMMVPIVKAVVDELRESRRKIQRSRRNSEAKVNDANEVDWDSQNKSLTDVAAKTDSTIFTLSSELISSKQNDERTNSEDSKWEKEKLSYYLGILYAANIGGTGTITGSPTNIVFIGILDETFPDATGVNFASWMMFNVPVMLINTMLAWLWLQIILMGLLTGGCKASDNVGGDAVRAMISRKHRELGPVTWHQGCVSVLFLILVLLWFFRAPEFITGWADLLPAVSIKDATPAMCIVFLLFVFPSNLNFLDCKRKEKKVSPSLLNWPIVQEKLPWGVVLLMGGGYAMADATQESGLSAWLGEQLRVLDALPQIAVVSVVCVMSTFLTEVCSNSAVANIVLPVLAELSKSAEIHPVYLMMPATLCCSYSFMLPIATPSNAIIAEAANIKHTQMMKYGIVMNFLTILVLLACFNSLGVVIYDLHEFPEWAN